MIVVTYRGLDWAFLEEVGGYRTLFVEGTQAWMVPKPSDAK